MLLKRLIIFLFFASFFGGIIFFIFWDFPAPTKTLERKIEINRFN